MTWMKRFGTATLASVCIALLLAALPRLDAYHGARSGERSVFKRTTASVLTGENVVHELAQLRLSEPIRRVDFSASMLIVDLESGEPFPSIAVYEDLAAIVRLGLLEHSNVKRVLIRILEANPHTNRHGLLLDLEASREALTGESIRQWKERRIDVKTMIGTVFPVTFHGRWEH